jgi:FMN reductase
MSRVVVLLGSPQGSSRSSWVAREVVSGLGDVRIVGPGTFRGDDVLLSRKTPETESFVASVRDAPAIVLATPVYKATYSGALKALVDLLPEDSLRGRPWLAIATSRSVQHVETVTRALEALAGFFEASAVHRPLVVLDEELPREGERFSPTRDALARIVAARAALAARVSPIH